MNRSTAHAAHAPKTKNPPDRSGGWGRSRNDAGSGARGLQRIALEPRRILLQHADAAGFGFVAPGLQLAQPLGGVVAARFEHLAQARAILDQRADARTLCDPGLQLLARLG